VDGNVYVAYGAVPSAGPVREWCADVSACVHARRVSFGRERRVRWFREGSVPVPDDASTRRSPSSLFTPRVLSIEWVVLR
jgi:hypothetical protein